MRCLRLLHICIFFVVHLFIRSCLLMFFFFVRLSFLLPSIYLSIHFPVLSTSVFAYLLQLTGFLQITPDGSPQAQRRGELGGKADVSGSFCLQTSALGFTSQKTTEEHQVSTSKDESVTLVTTRTTKHTIMTETQQEESPTTETETHRL